MNMYLFELKSLKKQTIIWVSAMIALAALYLSIYPSIAKDANEFKELLSNYPSAVREMLGINLDSIASLTGFYSMVFSFIMLCGGIQAMNLGVSILSKESRERTADFLLVKPISRSAIIGAKLIAALTILIITNIVFNIAVTILANIFKTNEYNYKLFFLINLTLFFVQLIFTALGLAVSVFFKKIKNILPISLGFIFGFYLIGAILAVGEEKDKLRFISPFKYFDIDYITKNEGYEIFYLLLSVIIVIISIVTVYLIYNKKDIHAVS